MPRWLARAGFMAALFALLRYQTTPRPDASLICLGSDQTRPMLSCDFRGAGGILGLLWVLAVSDLMLAGLAGRGADSPRRLDRGA
jgi:hypothetical protein